MELPGARMPAVFFGHGTPLNALGGPHVEAWRALGHALPRPEAILMVSAHWETEDETAVTAMARPRTIHDFRGFPPELHAMQYPAPGSPALAERVRRLSGLEGVVADHDWGLDHGTWSVLVHAWPAADVPVVQLSLNRSLSPRQHYDLGRQLTPLRDEGVLVAASGDIVHNLAVMRRDGSNEAFDWAVRFDGAIKDALRAGDHDRLIAWAEMGDDARLSVPTDEHFLPLLYVVAQQQPGERASFFNEAVDLGTFFPGATLARIVVQKGVDSLSGR